MKTSHTNISGILYAYKNGWVVHYSDIVWIQDINVRLDSMANNLQKQKGQQNYKVGLALKNQSSSDNPIILATKKY